MKTFFYRASLCLTLVQAVWADQQKFDADSPEAQEAMAMITEYHLARPSTSLAYQSVAIQQMLAEANYFAERLKLPTVHPIQIGDVRYPLVFSPWYSMIKESNSSFWPATVFTNRIFDPSIPREQRAHALKIGVSGVLETTNFEFSFTQGKLLHVMRLSEHEVEYYAHDLDKLIGKPSLIDTNGAYQLATQWLLAVNVDVKALERQFPHSVNQLRYQPHGSTNLVFLPIFYVGFGTNNAPKWMPVDYDPAVEVEILGTTKELQELLLYDAAFSQRPILLITNAPDLIRTPNPPTFQLQNSKTNPP